MGPLFYPLWVRSFHLLWVRSSTRCGSALLASFHQDHPSVRVHPVGCLELLSCTGSPASLFASASDSPRERRTPSFAVWCLGLSRACVLLLRSSWHSMSRSPWHSMAFQRRFPTSCSPVHVLTHVFSSARFFTCCVWLRVVWLYPTPLAPLPSARCACRGRCLQSSRASPGTPRCWSLCLEGLHTAPFVGLCSAWFPAIVCSGSSSSRRHPSQVISLSTDAIVVWFPPLRPPGSTPAEAQSLRLFAAVAAAFGCVPRGQRALLDADMLELIDRSACLVEPVSVESCAPSVLVLSPAASTSSAASGRCSRMSFPRGLVEGLLLPESSLLAAPVVHCDSCSWMIGTLLFRHVVDVMFFLTDLLCFVFLLHNCESCGRRDPLVRCAVPPFLHGFSELSLNEAASPSSAVTSG